MFVGHYSAAFLAKRVAPEIPLPVYFVACQVIDLFWAVFVLLGVEKVRLIPHFTETNSLDLYFMPFTHSLPGALAWSLGVALLYIAVTKPNPQRMRNAMLFGAVVSSHWLLDFLAHRPDLPLWYDSFKVGLGLWNFMLFELFLELALLWGSLLVALKISGENRRRYLILGVVMSFSQILSLILSPGTSASLAIQLLLSYAFLTVCSHFADKRHPAPVPT